MLIAMLLMMAGMYKRWKKTNYVLVMALLMLSGAASLLSLFLDNRVFLITATWQTITLMGAVLFFYNKTVNSKVYVLLGATLVATVTISLQHNIALAIGSLLLFGSLCWVGYTLRHTYINMVIYIAWFSMMIGGYILGVTLLYVPEIAALKSILYVVYIGFTLLSFHLMFARIINLMLAITKSSVIDPLTKLYNRRYFNQQLDKMAVKEPVSMIFMDIDDFKALNDTKGHEEGDRVLKEVADITKNIVQAHGIVGRYGGEEIVAAVKEDRQEELAERIRQTIEEKTGVTVSIGVSSLREGMSVRDLVVSADENMYQAKTTGKNKVVSA